MRGAKVKRLGKRVAQGAGVLALALLALFAVGELFGGDDEAAGPPPVSVRVLAPGTFDSAHPYAPYYVVPRKRVRDPGRLSAAATSQLVTRPEAALARGALAGSPQVVRLQLRSTTDDPVRVLAVRAHVVSDAPPLRGWFTAQPACDFQRVQVAKLDLDSGRGRTRYVGADGASSRTLALELSRGEPAVLELQAATRSHRVAWTATLTIGREGAPPQQLSVDDGGDPFRVTSVRASRGYAAAFGATGVSGFSRMPGWDRRGVTGC